MINNFVRDLPIRKIILSEDILYFTFYSAYIFKDSFYNTLILLEIYFSISNT